MSTQGRLMSVNEASRTAAKELSIIKGKIFHLKEYISLYPDDEKAFLKLKVLKSAKDQLELDIKYFKHLESFKFSDDRKEVSF